MVPKKQEILNPNNPTGINLIILFYMHKNRNLNKSLL